MWVRRRQLPIGQGCFHTGSIGHQSIHDQAPLNYIYDCGSTDRAALTAAIQVYVAGRDQLQALFVSHLDNDHVAGLDQLLARVSVESVYIPYVDDALALMDLLEAEASGAISASLIEAAIEPELWFGRRGVRRVVRVGPGGGAPPDGLPVGGGPMPETGPVVLKESPPAKPVKKGKDGLPVELLELSAGAVLAVMAQTHRLDWMLYPYVDPAPIENRKAFGKAIEAALNLSSLSELSADRLSRALRDQKERRKLKECYEEIVPGGARRAHNRVSMSLYSGPASPHPATHWEYSAYASYHRYWLLEQRPRETVGWIGTGDALLSREAIRAAWFNAFRSLERKVSTLLLPHHGSRHSFHPELLDIAGLRLCVASAGDPSPYGHPHPIVVDEIRARRHDFALVTQTRPSGLVEFIESRP